MNLGQFITSYSPLPSATVADHLLALQIGTGAQTVYAAQLNVLMIGSRIESTIRPKAKISSDAVSAHDVENTSCGKSLFSLLSSMQISPLIESKEIDVTIMASEQIESQILEQKSYTTKKGSGMKTAQG